MKSLQKGIKWKLNLSPCLPQTHTHTHTHTHQSNHCLFLDEYAEICFHASTDISGSSHVSRTLPRSASCQLLHLYLLLQEGATGFHLQRGPSFIQPGPQWWTWLWCSVFFFLLQTRVQKHPCSSALARLWEFIWGMGWRKRLHEFKVDILWILVFDTLCQGALHRGWDHLRSCL